MRIILLILIALPGILFPARGQLCNGSLGDPVVHITFGSGGNPGTALSAATTSYNFITADCPDDGAYTVRNASNACHGNTWHTLSNDHTGNPNGYFMLVNASFQPGDFYVETVNGLCVNTTYEFAAWVANMLRTSACGSSGIDPNLTFQIETTSGTVLATYNTAEIPETTHPEWKQYGLFFTTPPGVSSVVVRITNNAPGGCGNDLALDDITFRPCGPMVGASLNVNGDTSVLVCEGDNTVFPLNGNYSAGYADPVFQWQERINDGNWTNITGATNPDYTRPPVASPGTYRYRLTVSERTNAGSASCRIASNNIVITVHPVPVPGVDDNMEACQGTLVTLQASDGSRYAWTGPGGFTSTAESPAIPDIQFNQAGKYYVTVFNDACSQEDSTELLVRPAVTATAGNDAAICEGSATTLQASGGVQYLWTPATGLSDATIANPVAGPADTTLYQVTVFNQFGCSDSSSIAVNVWKKPVADAGPGKKMLQGSNTMLEGSATGTDVSWYWTPATHLEDATQLTPRAAPIEDITYTLHVISNNGCGSHTDDVFVRVFKEVVIPNAFSPNGDGINDVWRIEALETYPDADLQVFNRHGQKVYESRGYSKSWDGRYNGLPLPVGTYYYVIDLKTEFFPRLNGWVFIVK